MEGEVKAIPIEGVLDGWNKSELRVPPSFLDYGVYKFRYTVRMWGR